jgi:hypothetical protein
MKIDQFSTDLTFFARYFRRKFKMSYYDRTLHNQPAVFFGCGGYTQKQLVLNHTGLAVIVWGGSDSMFIDRPPQMGDYFRKNKDRIFHISHSHWIQTDLKEKGIEYIDRVVLPVEFDKAQFTVRPLGQYIYHYGSPSREREGFYGTTIVKEMMKMIGQTHVLANKFIITNVNAVPRDKIHHEYAKAFVGVRLTDHDNMSLSCIEMGLMGRRSIFNGNIPGAIPYEKKEAGHVMELIIKEFQYSEPDYDLSKEMWDFVQDDQKWCNTEFYK